MASRVVPQALEPVSATPRKAMTPARRARVLARFGGKCAALGCEVNSGLQIDHTIALELGGKDDDENLRPLCTLHHLTKTRLDMKLIAKMRRRQKKAIGQPRKPSRIKSRGFGKQSRPFPKRKVSA